METDYSIKWPGFITTRQASERLGVSCQRFFQIVSKGELTINRQFSPGMVSIEEINVFLSRKERLKSDYVGVVQASKILGVSFKDVYELAKSGVIEGEPRRVGSKHYLINKQSLENIRPVVKSERKKYIRKKYIKLEGYISATEASRRLNTSVSNIYGLAKSGRLQSITRNAKTGRLLIKEPCVLEDLVTVDQASRRLKTTSKRIWDFIQDNRIEFIVNNDTSVLIFGSSLDNPDLKKSVKKRA